MSAPVRDIDLDRVMTRALPTVAALTYAQYCATGDEWFLRQSKLADEAARSAQHDAKRVP